MAGVQRLHPGGIDAGKIARGTGGDRHSSVQRAQLAREQRADAAAADHKAACALQGIRGLFHRELYGTLAGREIVCVLPRKTAA